MKDLRQKYYKSRNDEGDIFCQSVAQLTLMSNTLWAENKVAI